MSKKELTLWQLGIILLFIYKIWDFCIYSIYADPITILIELFTEINLCCLLFILTKWFKLQQYSKIAANINIKILDTYMNNIFFFCGFEVWNLIVIYSYIETHHLLTLVSIICLNVMFLVPMLKEITFIRLEIMNKIEDEK